MIAVPAPLQVLLRSFSQHAPLRLDHGYFTQHLVRLAHRDLSLRALTIATAHPGCLETLEVMDLVVDISLLRWRELRSVSCVDDHFDILVVQLNKCLSNVGFVGPDWL